MNTSVVSRNPSARDRDLHDAGCWKRAAINMTEELLTVLKAALFDSTLPAPEAGEIYDIETMLSWLRRLDGTDLVSEFRGWRDDYPDMTAAMVRAAKEREREERRALMAYLQLPAAGGSPVSNQAY